MALFNWCFSNHRESLEELEANPRNKRIIPQELKVIEEFPEKVN